MARYIYQGVYQDGNGRVVDDGTVKVYLAGTTTLASVYETASGGSAVNSVTTQGYDDNYPGKFEFYVDDADYPPDQLFDVELTKTDYNAVKYENISILPYREHVYYAVSGITDQGSTSDSNSIASLVSKIGSSEAVIVLRFGTYTFGTNLTIPKNITLEVYRDASISIDSGVTLTINGQLNADRCRVFSGDGSVSFGTGVDCVHPEWFGAVGDGFTDDTTAVQKASTAANGNAEVKFGSWKTYIVSSVTLPDGSVLTGVDAGMSIIKHKSATTTSMFVGASGSSNTYVFRNLGFDGNKSNQFGDRADTSKNNLIYLPSTGDLTVDNCRFVNSVRSAIRVSELYSYTLITGSKFIDGAEHSGTSGEDTNFININGGDTDEGAQVTITNCLFKQSSAPSADGYSPGGIVISGKFSATNTKDNVFINVGQVAGGNSIGCIDLYTWADNSIIRGNKFYGRQYVALKIQNSGKCIVSENIVAASSSATRSYVAVVSPGVRPSGNQNRDTQDDIIFSNNYIESGVDALLQIDATDPDQSTTDSITKGFRRVSVIGNILKTSADTGIRIRYCDGDLVISNNQILGITEIGIDIQNFADYAAAPDPPGSITIMGNNIDAGYHGIYYLSGANSTKACIVVNGNTISGTATGYSAVVIKGTTTNRVSSVALVGNVMRSSAGKVYTIQYIDRCTVTGNVSLSSTVLETDITNLFKAGNVF